MRHQEVFKIVRPQSTLYDLVRRETGYLPRCRSYLVAQYVFNIPIVVQVYIKGDEAPRCLHEWTPHDGKPVTSLIFLDDHSQE